MQYRHGDVFLRRVQNLPAGAINVAASPRGVVLAEGEATGHAHVMTAETVKLWAVGEQRYVTVSKPSVLDHEEHGVLTIPEGTYEVIIQREYSPEAIRRVAD